MEDVCARFELALNAGKRPRLEDFLQAWQEPECSQLLRTLLSVELAYLTEKGQPVARDAYDRRFPSHRAVIAEVFELWSEQTLAETRILGAEDDTLLMQSCFDRLRLHAQGGLGQIFRAGDQGFDSVEIATPSGFTSVDSLRIEGINIHPDEFTWTRHEDDLGFEVKLPRKLGTTDSGVVLEVVFNAPVLREVGTFFDGRVFDSTKPHEVRQQIVPGNAADEAESELLSVRTAVGQSLLFAPRVSPNPFTPNNDAINDVLNISYALLRVTAPVPVVKALLLEMWTHL